MKQKPITFLVTGLIAGLTCVALVFFGPVELAMIILIIGVGPVFFLSVVAGMVISGAQRQLAPGLLRYFGGLVLCTLSYFAAVVVLLWVWALSQWLALPFGFDIGLGLSAAGAVGASGIAVFAALLTKRWSKSFLVRLMLAALITILATLLVHVPLRKDWSLLGVLFPVGNALFCYLMGARIWQHSELERRIEALASEPNQLPA